MEPASLTPLPGWESFYVIIGSSAAALTGLQFVVVALVVDVRRGNTMAENSAFSTPTVVHFGAALLVSALLSAPWESLRGPALALGAIGFSGAVYSMITVRRMKRTKIYTPVLEDWIWHVVNPFIAYISLGITATMLVSSPVGGLFVVAAVALLLVVIGLHNAWDTVTFVATMGHEGVPAGAEAKEAETVSAP